MNVLPSTMCRCFLRKRSRVTWRDFSFRVSSWKFVNKVHAKMTKRNKVDVCEQTGWMVDESSYWHLTVKSHKVHLQESGNWWKQKNHLTFEFILWTYFTLTLIAKFTFHSQTFLFFSFRSSPLDASPASFYWKLRQLHIKSHQKWED